MGCYAVAVVVLMLCGCSSPGPGTGPRSLTRKTEDYSELKRNHEQYLAAVHGKPVGIDWSHFDAATTYLAAAPRGSDQLQKAFNDRVGLAQTEVVQKARRLSGEKVSGALISLHQLPRLLAAARLIDSAQSPLLPAIDSGVLLRQALGVLTMPQGAGHNSIFVNGDFTHICVGHAQLAGRSADGCVVRSLEVIQARLIALASLRVERRTDGFAPWDVVSFFADLLMALNRGRPEDRADVIAGIDKFYEFNDLMLRPPAPSVAERDKAAKAAFLKANALVTVAITGPVWNQVTPRM